MVDRAFSRELRLLTPSEFSFVFEKPLRVGSPCITLLCRKNQLSHPRLGLTISKKNVKHAHDRNRIKRLTRETFRKRKHELPAMDFVVVAKRGIADLDNYTLTIILKKLWHRYYR